MIPDNNLYFDIAATTPIDPRVVNHINDINKSIYGNPSSIHQSGQKAHNIIERSRKTIASVLGCKQSEIYFTSGGTESNNIALRGTLEKGDHLITSQYEHPAILEVAKYLENSGIEVSYVKPDFNGIVASEKIEKVIKDNTKMISIMLLNNELGTINPLHEISELCNKKNILVHTDAVQYIGKSRLNLSNTYIDLLSIGAHKFYGPKGIGALYIKAGVHVNPLIIGGGQEKGISPGTQNPSLISGMSYALELSIDELNKNTEQIQKMEKLFFTLLDKTSIKYTINGTSRLSGFINITFFDYDAHSLLLNLDMQNIAISYGSACSSGSAGVSSSLLAIGMDEETAKKTVRISIGKFITEDNIIQLIDALKNIIIK